MNSVKWTIIGIIITVLVVFSLLIAREISSRGETRLVITTQPEKAEVYLSGQRFISPLDTTLPSGSYSAQVIAPGYKSLTKNIRVRPNRRNEFSFSLTPEETFLPPEGAP
jgi:hypothetical protein